MATPNGTATAAPVFLVVGPRGWIGGMLIDMLKAKGYAVHASECRMEEREKLLAELDRLKPTHVLNCAGVTGRPNVDWCEDNKQATIRSNVIGTLNLADCCYLKGVHMTNFATGCIYHYDDVHKEHGVPFKEEDAANFSGSFYSYTKAMVEKLLAPYDNVLTLRLRMPVSDDLSPRSFVTKISKYERVVNIPNSMTMLTDLLPVAVTLALNRHTGVYNFTNPGAISHNEVLALYKKYVKPDFEWKNFTVDEQAKILKAGRSNCELDTTKLVEAAKKYGIEIPEVHVAYEECFKRMAKNLAAAQ
ncbi:hypothetical protein DFJ74DRAFT_674714 [Hyaloraphidium curvatum]|nr:hypothetical protein DFJ74DRAFT_674714 [Hyaloraphidium curvatum]